MDSRQHLGRPVFDCRDSWSPPIVREIIFDWRDYQPLAMAETTKFYKRQEWGRFRYEELLTVALDALALSPGVNYAKKAIRGALVDYVLETINIVHPVEMTEDEFERTRGLVHKAGSRDPVQVHYENGVKVTVYPSGPYCSNAQLLAGAGNVSSKHGKVPVAIGRTTYDDGWNQIIGGWVRAKVDNNDDESVGPATKMLLLESGDTDYKGRGRKKRFSVSYFNARDARRPPAELVGRPFVKTAFLQRGKVVRWLSPQVVGSLRKDKGGKVEVDNPNRLIFPAIRRTAGPPKLDITAHGRRTSKIVVDLTKFGREPGPKRDFPDLKLEGPKSGLITWHREAGYLQFDDDGRPDCWWGLPDRGVFCRPTKGILLRPDQNPWRRGIDFFPEPAVDAPSPSRASLDRAVEHFWKNTVARWIAKKSRRKLFLPEPEKSPVWADVICERGVPIRLAHGPAALGGSCAGGAAFPIATAHEWLAGGTIESAPSAEGAVPSFLLRVNSGRCAASPDALDLAQGGRSA
jgi:hypothetical protein